MANLLNHIFGNSNFSYVNEVRVFELLALNLLIISIIIAYYTYFDKNKNETVSNTKITKYGIISILSLLDICLTMKVSYMHVNLLLSYYCTLINTIKVCLFITILLLFIFMFWDQLVQLSKEKYYKSIDIL
jgi:hypothetical protein